LKEENIPDLGEFDAPILVFGGAYGNLQATIAMRKKADDLGISSSHVFCNGDTVAYCAQPEKTVEQLKDWGVRVMQGNCEKSLAEGSRDCGCGFEPGTTCSLLSDNWYGYCQEQLGDSTKKWMGELPAGYHFKLSGMKFRLVHATVTSINRYLFSSSDLIDMQSEWRLSQADVVIGGHVGIPFHRNLDDQGHWINSGVIGMPANDGTRDGWYLLLIPENDSVRCEWHRLEYEAKRAQTAMRTAGLNNGYADALVTGIWPSMDVLPDFERRAKGCYIKPWSVSLS
jgi:predicted phosphodiesterase